MSSILFRDPKDAVYAQIERAFRDIPIPRTRGSGAGWFFTYSNMPLFIAKMINHIFSLDGIILIDFGLPLRAVIFQELKKCSRSGSDSTRVEFLQIELVGAGDKLLYDIIERTTKILPENGYKLGRYLKDDSAKKKFISRIIDELFNQKIGIILSATECLTLVQEARLRYSNMQDQANSLVLTFEKKRKQQKP